MTAFSNRLAKETSPYLLQHAQNPVDWYPWGDEALLRAKEENKPILVSIGYAACHWCHVMERESFEDEDTAKVMNEHFVNIKIDREERPDLDHIYMDAVQAMTGSGGWPLNVFLTPEGKPFYGGTYFPPRAAFNRPSWKDVLSGVASAFRDRRQEINSQAQHLTDYIANAGTFDGGKSIDVDSSFGIIFSKENTKLIFDSILQIADRTEGGFGNAPKFPQTFTIQYLLHYYFHSKDEGALNQALLSLDKMVQGGIYDQVGGGFARYSTDREWLAPHFEKMLYDNALLVTVLAEAYQLTHKLLYKRAIEQTLAFVEREMCTDNKGFYAALDADSEGIEGKFYVWSKAEIESVLGADAGLFCKFFDVTEKGNWEHQNILNIKITVEEFADQDKISVDELYYRLDECRQKLLQHRDKRTRPQTDDKILLGWNALMNSAYSKAYAALGNRKYLELAISNMDFILQRFQSGDGSYFHTFKNDVAKYPAFLDDYAYTIQALINLQEITGNPEYLVKAKEMTEWVEDHFSDDESGYFFFTNKDQQDIIVRKKEVYDGAVPSGNAVMAVNLYYLGVIFDKMDWKKRAVKLCSSLHQVVSKYPTSFGIWATLILALTYNISEIAIVGGSFDKIRDEFLRIFIPFRIVQSSPHDNKDFPLLAHKPYTPQAQLFLCRNYSCESPVTELNDLIRLMESV